MSPLGVTVLAIILAGIHTYRNDGILTSIAVAVIIMNGYTLYGVISLNNPQPDYRLLTSVGTAIMYGAPIGIITSTIAYVLRRFARSPSPAASKEKWDIGTPLLSKLWVPFWFTCIDHSRGSMYHFKYISTALRALKNRRSPPAPGRGTSGASPTRRPRAPRPSRRASRARTRGSRRVDRLVGDCEVAVVDPLCHLSDTGRVEPVV